MTNGSARCTWRHPWRKSLVTNPFSPLIVPDRILREKRMDVECGKGGRGKSGWSGLRPGETGQPVQTSRSRPNNPVRSLETGRIRGNRGGKEKGRLTSIDPNIHVTRFVIILYYTPRSLFKTDNRDAASPRIF